MKRAFWGVLLGAALCGICSAQSAPTDARTVRLDQIAKSYTANNAFMGTVLVIEGDRVLLDKGYGSADLEWNIPNAPDVKFRLGSLTKQFTATLVLQFQQQGKLNITDPVSKYLPDAPKTWEKITLAELLGHTSGIPNFTNEKEFMTWRMNPHTTAEELAFFENKPLEFEPGSKFEYSNSNSEVLGAVIEKVSGKSYGEMLQQNIFGPLGMKDSGLDSDELILPKRAQGYMHGDKGLIHAVSESMTVPWAAGSLYSTTGDLLTWEHGLFGLKVLNADSLKLMTTPGKGNYGLGVFLGDHGGVKTVEHGGGIEGFNTFLLYAPEKKITVVVLSNVNGAAPDEMSGKLLDAVLGRPVTLSSDRKAEPMAAAELQRFAGVYQLAPQFSIMIAVTKEGLTGQGTGQPPFPLYYEGMKDGHPWFFTRVVDAQIEFVPDASGNIASMILHQNGHDAPGKRQ